MSWRLPRDARALRAPPGGSERPTDPSHSAIVVDLNKCIHCKLCVQACHDIQGNNVIGMEGRGYDSTIVFDMSDPMGSSTCVACGECVQVCPTNALSPSTRIPDEVTPSADEIVNSVCPYCGVGCQLALPHRPSDALLGALDVDFGDSSATK